MLSNWRSVACGGCCLLLLRLMLRTVAASAGAVALLRPPFVGPSVLRCLPAGWARVASVVVVAAVAAAGGGCC